MKKIWIAVIGIITSANQAHADTFETVMSYDEEAINMDTANCFKDEVRLLERLLSEYEYLSAEEQIEAKSKIDELIKILTENGILRGATYVCAICQGDK
jgi:hypothetical protein